MVAECFAKGLVGFWAATKNEFVRATGLGLIEPQIDSPDPLRLIEDKTDGLRSRPEARHPWRPRDESAASIGWRSSSGVSSRVAAVSRFSQAWSETEGDSEIVRPLDP